MLLQIENISERYLEYKTRTIVTVFFPVYTEMVSLSTCWRLNDIIDINAMNTDNPGMNIKRWNEKNSSEYIFNQQAKHFTVSDWFKYTPNISNVLDPKYGCRIRIPKQFAPTMKKAEECLKIFNITKYIQSEYMCYLFNPKYQGYLEGYKYTLTPGSLGLIFRIFLNPKYFHSIRKVNQAVEDTKSSNMLNFIFSKEKYSTASNQPSTEVTYRMVSRQMLEAPYDSKCVKEYDKYGSAVEYFLSRANEISMKEYKIATPFVPIYDSNSNSRILFPYDYLNNTITNTISNLVEYDWQTSCFCKYFSTRITIRNVNRLSASVYWPFGEMLSFTYVPVQDLIDYIVYVCSCVGIWFGLSAYSVYDGILFAGNMIKKNETVIQTRNICRKCNCSRLRNVEMKIHLIRQLINELYILITYKN